MQLLLALRITGGTPAAGVPLPRRHSSRRTLAQRHRREGLRRVAWASGEGSFGSLWAFEQSSRHTLRVPWGREARSVWGTNGGMLFKGMTCEDGEVQA